MISRAGLSLLAPDRHQTYVIDPHRAAELIVQTLARPAHQPNEKKVRVWPRCEINLFEGPRLGSRSIRGNHIQMLLIFGIYDLKPHPALGRNLIGAQESLKTIVGAWRNQDELR